MSKPETPARYICPEASTCPRTSACDHAQPHAYEPEACTFRCPCNTDAEPCRPVDGRQQ